MAHHEELLNAILDVIKAEYPQDIGIMMIYGSYVNGTANETSDLDMIYVPKTERGRRLARTFMLAGSGNDLWGTDWERLERYASFDDMKVSVLTDSRLVYYDTEEDKQRYEALKKRAQDIENGPLTPDLVEKAEGHLATAKQYYGALCLGDNLTAAGGILFEINNVICLLNHTYLRFGMKRFLKEMSGMKRLPTGFLDAFQKVSGAETHEQAKEACHDLINLVDGFLTVMKQEIVPRAVPADFTGLYEEISTHWNKIRLSCARNDALTALLAATSLQAELDYVQQRLDADIAGLHFINHYNPCNLSGFACAAQKAEDAFVALLNESGVPICSYNTVDEFKRSLLE